MRGPVLKRHDPRPAERALHHPFLERGDGALRTGPIRCGRVGRLLPLSNVRAAIRPDHELHYRDILAVRGQVLLRAGELDHHRQRPLPPKASVIDGREPRVDAGGLHAREEELGHALRRQALPHAPQLEAEQLGLLLGHPEPSGRGLLGVMAQIDSHGLGVGHSPASSRSAGVRGWGSTAPHGKPLDRRALLNARWQRGLQKQPLDSLKGKKITPSQTQRCGTSTLAFMTVPQPCSTRASRPPPGGAAGEGR
jgi:hypothetical protein